MDFTQAPLFDSLLCFPLGEVQVDLHNEYECQSVNFARQSLQLSFSHRLTGQRLTLLFEDAVICLVSLENKVLDLTLDEFYKGRFEEKENVLSRYDQQGRSYYYLVFERGRKLQLLARRVSAHLVKDAD